MMISLRDRRGRRRASVRPGRHLVRSSLPPPIAAGQDHATHTAREPRGERRQVTVLFCDLVGSTELAERLDPEELCDVMRYYQASCAQAIAPFGGYLAQTLGDGLLFYFGFPGAHEDDAVRAVRAGLAAIAAVQDPTGCPIQTSSRCAVRVGIHTGVVYAGEVGQFDTRADHALVGDVPNIAQRLQSLATPNELLLGPTTRKLIEEQFRLESMGPQSLKGLRAPLEVFRVRGESNAATRFDGRAPDSWAPLVGRDRELSELRTHWTLARHAQGQTVVLSGVAGIGKSRLADALRSAVLREAQVLSFQCSPYLQSSALHPLISLLLRLARIRAKDPVALKLGKLRRMLGDDDPHDERSLALLARLLRITNTLAPELDHLSGEHLLADTIDWTLRWMIARSRKQPLLVVLEDAHWSDPATRQLVSEASRALVGLRVMLLITERNGYGELERLKGANTIRVPALPPEDSHAIVQHFAADTQLRRRVVDEIVERSGGVPFFVEELTKAVLESSDGGTSHAVPATLKDSLMARLDSAGPFKMIAQRAACIGPQFSHAMIAHVCALDERTLTRGLRKLMELELLTCVSQTPEPRYAFRHSLLREAAYESLLLQERRAVHLAIAQLVQRDDPARVEREPELLARHYAFAGDARTASHLWLRAGELAQVRSGHADAIAYLNEGLRALATLERGAEEDRLEIELQCALARSRTSAEGWGGERVHAAYWRALTLSRNLGDRGKELEVLWGPITSLETRGQIAEAAALAREYVQVAERHAQPAGLLIAHCAASLVSFFQGRFADAEEHANEVRLHYCERDGAHWVKGGALDPLVLTHLYESMRCWVQGQPDRGAEQSECAIARARVLRQPFQLCHALLNGSWVRILRQEHTRALCQADEALALAEERRILLFRGYGPLMLAPALMSREPSTSTIERLEQCYQYMVSADVRLHIPPYLCHIAQAYLELGLPAEARSRIELALDTMESTDERWIEPELLRVQAAVMYALDAHADAPEQLLLRALHKARDAGARGFELRIACDLCEQLKPQGRFAEGQTLVASVLHTFHEGADTADVRRARRYALT